MRLTERGRYASFGLLSIKMPDTGRSRRPPRLNEQVRCRMVAVATSIAFIPAAKINIVSRAATHTPLPRWVRLCRATSPEARRKYPQKPPRRHATGAAEAGHNPTSRNRASLVACWPLI
jgi:hypothetical protein